MIKHSYNKIFRLTFQSALLAIIAGCFVVSAAAQCAPGFSTEAFRKVYRNNKMTLEGLADLTGDGKPDAYGYELQANGSYQNIVILANDGNGGFGDPVIVPTTLPINPAHGTYQSVRYGAVAVGDLNGDGKGDLVVRAASNPNAFFTLLSGKGGGYTQSLPTLINVDEYVVSTADINSDGKGDIVTNTVPRFENTGGQGTLSYRLGNANGTFGAAVQLTNIIETMSPVVGDFNNDGKSDVAVSYYPGTSSINLKVLINLGGGLFSNSADQLGVNLALSGVADLNGDGKLDIWADGGVLVNDGNGNFTKKGFSAAAPGFPVFQNAYGSMFLMDFDGNGTKDVVSSIEGGWQEIYRKRYFTTYSNDGAANFSSASYARPFLGIPANMTGDSKDEQVIFINSTNDLQKANAANETAVIVRQNSCTAPANRGQNKLVDFGGDGVSDLAMWRPTDGRWSFTSNVISNSFKWGSAAFGDIPIPGDFDGDGRTDAAVFRDPTGDWHIQRSSDGSYVGVHFGKAGDIPIPGDYNGDGKADIAVFRPSEGDWYISYTDSTEYLFTHFGATGDIPIPGDYDGDGRDDIAVFRPSDGGWYGLKSNGGEFFAIHWGLAGDIPIPGDYDMDGKTDVAVFRPGNHYWYIYRSFDGNATFVPFGLSNDVPMAVDTNGDGVIEIGTYRPTTVTNGTSAWYASNQNLYTWNYYGAQNEKPLRLKLPN